MKDLIKKMVTEGKLILENGKLFEKHGVVAGMPSLEVLNTPEIAVVSAQDGKPIRDSDESRFWFNLNHAPCKIWVELFQETLGTFPRTEIKDTTLYFDCYPNDLGGQLSRVRGTVDKTNADYKNLREELITLVKEEEKRREESQKREEDRAKATRDALDKLKF